MNNSIKNEKGFTLVELIVVMAIFGIIMGAILNIIRPTNEVYNNNEATMETNITGSGVINYIDDQLKYATNVLVLKDYAGVPEVSATGSLGGGSVSYKNCIIIDNNNLRGYSESGYSGDDTDTAQKRMGCTGCVILVNKLNEGGLNLNNSSVGMGSDFYGNFKFDISAGINKIDDMYTLDVLLETYQPVYEGGAYNFTKTRYSTEKAINLVNINIDNSDSFIVQDYIDFSTAADYTKYPAAAAPADATVQQQVYYDTDPSNTYTYIFYDKKSAADELKYKVTFAYSDSDPDNPGVEIHSYMVNAGKTLPANFVPSLPLKSGYLAPYWTDETGSTVSFESTPITVTEDMTFYAVYALDTTITKYTVSYYNADYSKIVKTNEVVEGNTAPALSTIDGLDEEKQYIEGWYSEKSGSGSKIDDTPIDKDTSFYPNVKNKHKVDFKVDGSVVSTVYVIDGKKAEAPAITPVAPDEGNIFSKWVVEGTSTSVADEIITSDTVFVPLFIEKSASDLTIEASNPEYSNWQTLQYKVTILNNSSEDIYDWYVEFDLPSSEFITLSASDWRVSTNTSGTHNELWCSGRNSWDCMPVEAGKSLTLTLNVLAPDIDGNHGVYSTADLP